MVVEERVYRLRPGCIPEYFELYARKGLGPQRRYLKAMLGYYASELGDLNEVVHLWAHDSLDAREDNRARMRADPEFRQYWQEVRGMIVAQRTRIMKPAPFFAGALAQMIAVATQANFQAED